MDEKALGVEALDVEVFPHQCAAAYALGLSDGLDESDKSFVSGRDLGDEDERHA